VVPGFHPQWQTLEVGYPDRHRIRISEDDSGSGQLRHHSNPPVTNARDWKCVGLIAPRSTFSFCATSLWSLRGISTNNTTRAFGVGRRENQGAKVLTGAECWRDEGLTSRYQCLGGAFSVLDWLSKNAKHRPESAVGRMSLDRFKGFGQA
jgi:hypothetical protein